MWYKSCFLVIALIAHCTSIKTANKEIHLQQDEIAEILAAQDTYVYFGPAMCPLIADLPALRKMAHASGLDAKHLDAVSELVAQGYATAPAYMVKAAVEEAAACIAACKADVSAQELERIVQALEVYDHALQSGAADLVISEDTEPATRGTKKFDNIIVRNQASVGSLFVGGDEIVNHNLMVNNNELVGGNLTVNGNEIINGNLLVKGGTIFTLTGSQTVNGTLKVVGGDILLGNANAAGTVGVLKLGVDPIFLYNTGTSNFFAGDYTAGLNTSVTGANNISIGTQANSTLTASADTIAIGRSSQATGGSANIAIGLSSATTGGANAIAVGNTSSANATDAISVGNGATSNIARGIAIGSKDSTSTGAAPTASAVNGIAIGSASGTTAGPVAANNAIAMGAGAAGSATDAIAIGAGTAASATSAIAVGFTTAASGSNSVAIGNGVAASATNSIAIGGSGGITASGINSIAIIGSSSGGNALAILGSASGLSSIALGSGAVTFAAATNSVVLGTGAFTSQPSAIVLGNPGDPAIAVGIGTSAPGAKLHVVGAGTGTPVLTLNQTTATVANAPVLLNPATSGVAGTPLHYNGANQIFGFTSSKRYKTNIRSMQNESNILYNLTPVVYDAKEGYGEGSNIPGFIAEDVYEIAPHLAILNKDGQPENIAYAYMHSLAIKEIQKHQERLDAQNNDIQQLRAEIALLQAALKITH